MSECVHVRACMRVVCVRVRVPMYVRLCFFDRVCVYHCKTNSFHNNMSTSIAMYIIWSILDEICENNQRLLISKDEMK